MTDTLAFFGAFNPPTVAHLNLAGLAMERTGRKRVVFVPSRAAYIREVQKKDLAYTDEERTRMLRAAAETRPWMDVCTWEMEQNRQPRTYETLCHLREDGCTASLLIGSDKLSEMASGWKFVKEIAEEFGIVCLSRGTDSCEQIIRESPFLQSLSGCIQIVETPEESRQISSTEVRRKVAEIRRLRAELERAVPREILPLL